MTAKPPTAAEAATSLPVTLADIEAAAKAIEGQIENTPLRYSRLRFSAASIYYGLLTSRSNQQSRRMTLRRRNLPEDGARLLDT